MLDRFRNLRASDRRLLVESVWRLASVAIGLRLISFAALRRRIERRTFNNDDPQPVDRICWAMHAVGRRMPGTTCLAEALAVYAILRRHGHAPALRIGVRQGARPLEAHAWVECDGVAVVGAIENLSEHAVLS